MYEISEIASLLEANTSYTIGVNLFLYHAPAEVVSCAIIFPSNDPPRIEPETPGYLHGKFQVIVREIDYETGFAKCKEFDTALSAFNVDTPTIKIKQVRPLYQPRVYRRSEGGSLEFSNNYSIHYVQK